MQIGNDEAAHNDSNPKNAQETGDPQADAFRHSGFEQELCRFVALNEIHRPLEEAAFFCRRGNRSGGLRFRLRVSSFAGQVANPLRELRYRPVKFTFARTAAEGAAREADLEGSMAALLSDAI